MKKLSLASFATLLSIQLFSQAYMTSAGLRLGTDWGITVQQRVAKSLTVEGIVQSSLQREETMLTGLVEKHYPLVFRGLNIYMGGGLHKGWLNEPADLELGKTYKDPFGVSFVGGAELTLGRINVSYDFKPAVNLSGGEKGFYSQTAVSVRYAILDNKVYKKMQKQKRKKERRENGGKWKFWKKS